jgi:hypothetical protein
LTRWQRHQNRPSSSTRPSLGSTATGPFLRPLPPRRGLRRSRLSLAERRRCTPSPMSGGPFPQPWVAIPAPFLHSPLTRGSHQSTLSSVSVFGSPIRSSRGAHLAGPLRQGVQGAWPPHRHDGRNDAEVRGGLRAYTGRAAFSQRPRLHIGTVAGELSSVAWHRPWFTCVEIVFWTSRRFTETCDNSTPMRPPSLS